MKYLNKFLEAQKETFEHALFEIKNGKKESHWMWYVFPQIQGLGQSEVSEFYSLNTIDEAKDYLAHPILGSRLIEISTLLLNCDNTNIEEIFGYPDYLKLRSSMTLFSIVVNNEELIFNKILEKYYEKNMCDKTLLILNKNEQFY